MYDLRSRLRLATASEHQDSYCVSILSSFGPDDVETIRAGGVKISPEHAEGSVPARSPNFRP